MALTGRLVVRAVKVGADTQLSHLIRLVEQAQAQKAAIQRVADRICGVFVPAVLAAAAATLAGWLPAGAPAEHAFSAGLAVLIIACPCALGLATPAALVAACGRGAQLGIFVKGYQALETSRSVTVVVLDKTGTVSTGRMSLAGVLPAAGVTRAELLRYAGAVEQASEHAVAAAIAAAAKPEAGPLPQAEGFKALPGLGARGVVDGHEVVVGQERLFAGYGMAIPPGLAGQCRGWEQSGRTTVLIGWDGEVRGAVAVADTIKPSAAVAVAELRELGLHPILLTGDNEATARAIAAEAGIDEVIAGTLPADKAAVVTRLQAQGHQVAMVGDGVNDAPALAAADLGLALGSGTDVAMSAADLILLSDDLRTVPDAIGLSRATFRTIRRNLGWAFGYNAGRAPARRPRLPQPDRRLGRHDAVLGLRRRPTACGCSGTTIRAAPGAGRARQDQARPRAPCRPRAEGMRPTPSAGGRRRGTERPRGRYVRLHTRQGQLPQAAAPHRGPGPRPAADDRGGQVLHRHPHPGRRRDQGPAIGRPRPARGASQPLRHAGRGRRRRRRRREGPRSLGRDRPSRPVLNLIKNTERHPMTTTTYAVTGMSCEHCVNAVTTELGSLDGVSAVTVDLVADGNSQVTVASDRLLSEEEVIAALDEAGGYQISGN